MPSFRFRLFSGIMACGVLWGVVMVDGTFINFRGEQLRRAIEVLAVDLPDPNTR